MDGRPQDSPESLLEHQEWMRALARRLAQPSQQPDDLVQDVWVQALERPPAQGWPLRRWLGGVFRNVARQNRRESSRRSARERDVARPDETPSAVDRLATHQDVVQAVLALREPYRSAVVQRFYEGLPPRKIAAREGVPVATVKSRIARGLDLLRERLAKEYGGEGRPWVHALAPLFVPRSGLLSTSLGALAVSTQTKIAIAAAFSIAAIALVGTQGPTLFGGGSAEGDTAAADGDDEVALERPKLDGSPATGTRVAALDRARLLDVDERVEASADAPPAPAPVAAAGADPTYALNAIFVRPDRSKLFPPLARLTLTGEDGKKYTAETRDSHSAHLLLLPLGVYHVEVEAGGLRHVAHDLALTDTRGLESKEGFAQPGFFHRVTLWDDDWIPIIIRTKEGEPFRTISDENELDPKRFFVDAFALAASVQPIDATMPLPDRESEAAIFRPPPGWQSTEFLGNIAGSLQLKQPAPLWVGFWLHGVFFESRLLQPGDTELVFEISLEDLLARFATVRLRLVDRDTKAPVRHAQATLKANTSAHRRGDLSDVEPDLDGTLTFARVIPGTHELAISREGYFVQRQLELAPGEVLDLGDVEIGSGPAIRLRVVDADGEPAFAWLELAPYEAGRRTSDLYHPNLHRTTGDQGVYQLPVPDRPSIVRARAMWRHGGSRYGGSSPVSTLNVLIDPDNVPAELVLVTRERVDVVFEPMTPWVEGHRLTIHDELDLIVRGTSGNSDGVLTAELVEGRYRVVRWNGAEELDSVDIVVEKGRDRVLAP